MLNAVFSQILVYPTKTSNLGEIREKVSQLPSSTQYDLANIVVHYF